MKKHQKKIIWSVILLFIIIYIFRNFTYSENTKRRFITDEQGRALILHGVNANPDAKSDSLRVGWPQKPDYEILSEGYGFNFVRMLVLWDGIEPEKGQYDTAYFSRIRERLDWCHEAGLYVVLDMHQDLYALRYGGDGAPDWAIIDDGQPFEMQTPWELNYHQPAVIAAINNFWDKSRGHGYLQEHYIKAVVELVKNMKDHPAVIGYELYNEPTMVTKEVFSFEEKYLQSFYQKLIKEIRKVDTENWIFFEPTALGANQGFETNLKQLKDFREGEARLVYFPHIYTLDLDLADEYIGFPIFINMWANSRNKEVKKFNTPLLAGEFGLNLTADGSLDFLNSLMDMLEETASGWAYWAYIKNDKWSPFDEDSISTAARNILIRPYPQKVAGQPISYGYNQEENTFHLNFIAKADIKAPTEIYIPESDFPSGWELKVAQNQSLWSSSWEEKRNILKFTANIDKDTKFEIKITGKE